MLTTSDNLTSRTAIRNFLLGVPLLSAIVLTSGCASSMTPDQFNERLPKVTKSAFYSHASATKAISDGWCQSLVANRKYTAPIGLTVYGDLKNGALGIDQWVAEDGGNAYTIDNYEWISVGDEGVTQLIVYFDTLRCR